MSSNPQSSRISLAQLLLSILLGTSASVVCSLVFARTAAPKVQSVTPEPATRAAEPTKTAASSVPILGGELVHRTSPLDTQIVAAAEPEPPMDSGQRELVQERARLDQRARLAGIEAEGRDAGWSTSSADTLKGEIQKLAEESENAPRLDRVDCRTSGCVVTLEFPTFAAAQAGHAKFVTHPLGLRCMQTALLDVPEDPTHPTSVDVAFTQCVRD